MCPAHFFKAALRAQNSAHERKKAHTSALWKTAPVFAFLHLQLEHFFAKRAVYTSSTYFCSFEDLGLSYHFVVFFRHLKTIPFFLAAVLLCSSFLLSISSRMPFVILFCLLHVQCFEAVFGGPGQHEECLLLTGKSSEHLGAPNENVEHTKSRLNQFNLDRLSSGQGPINVPEENAPGAISCVAIPKLSQTSHLNTGRVNTQLAPKQHLSCRCLFSLANRQAIARPQRRREAWRWFEVCMVLGVDASLDFPTSLC